MPSKGLKAEIIDSICESIVHELEEMDVIDDSDTIDNACDTAIDEVCTVLEYGYCNPRGKVGNDF